MGGILHVHPTLRCNLACGHCYSESGPGRSEGLPLSLARGVLADAHALGYDVLSLSGGEPLLYRHLPELVDHARALGYRVQMVSNGFLVPRAAREGWLDGLSTIAISIDGYGARHDAMRRHPKAWAAVLRAIDALEPRRSSVGLNFTLSDESIDDLAAIVGLSLEHGIGLLQLHALESAGRGQELPGASADHLARCFASAALVCAAVDRRLFVQCDLMPSAQVSAEPPRVLRRSREDDAQFDRLAPVLVLDADGDVRPLSYAMPRSWSLGNAFRRPLRELADDYATRPNGAARLEGLWRRLKRATASPQAPAVVNVYGLLANLAQVV